MSAHAQWDALTDAREASGLRHAAMNFARAHHVNDPPLARMQTALAEALANAVMHRPAPPGTMAVKMIVDHPANRVLVRVLDDGPGLQAQTPCPGAGMGMPLMSAFTDELTIHARDGRPGTEVTMVFHTNTGR